MKGKRKEGGREGGFRSNNMLHVTCTYCSEDVQNGFSNLVVRQRVIWERTQPLLWGGGGGRERGREDGGRRGREEGKYKVHRR